MHSSSRFREEHTRVFWKEISGYAFLQPRLEPLTREFCRLAKDGTFTLFRPRFLLLEARRLSESCLRNPGPFSSSSLLPKGKKERSRVPIPPSMFGYPENKAEARRWYVCGSIHCIILQQLIWARLRLLTAHWLWIDEWKVKYSFKWKTVSRARIVIVSPWDLETPRLT